MKINSWVCVLLQEPEITPSILAAIPDVLKKILIENIHTQQKKRKEILLSSNGLANRFIFERWGIRSSQRRYHKRIFSEIREQCRTLFRYYLKKGFFQCQEKTIIHRFGVFRFDEIRGNLILGFVIDKRDSPFK